MDRNIDTLSTINGSVLPELIYILYTSEHEKDFLGGD